jgi:two-component system NarL family response regulator
VSEVLGHRKKSYKINIIEDSEIHRAWLEAELKEQDALEIVSINRLGRDGIDSVKHHKPDLVILDFQLEDMTGIEVARRIKAHIAGVKIFALTAHTEISIIERIINDKNIDALAIKGSRYLEANFVSAIFYVSEGGTYLDPSLLNSLRENGSSSALKNLTKREFEIFIQVNMGKSDNKIAQDLCIELSHVRNLKSRISRKIKDFDANALLAKLMSNSHNMH